MLSTGVPLLLSGDEVGKTQFGNNNPYCQDNEISWFDWSLTKTNEELFRFFRLMIEFRNANSLLRRDDFFDGAINKRGLKDIDWHGCKLHSPGWMDPASKILSFTMGAFEEKEPDIHVMMNMDQEPLMFDIPVIEERQWYRFVDTWLPVSEDILERGQEKLYGEHQYLVNPYSIVILISKA
jgi:glycogen operon protein